MKEIEIISKIGFFKIIGICLGVSVGATILTTFACYNLRKCYEILIKPLSDEDKK